MLAFIKQSAIFQNYWVQFSIFLVKDYLKNKCPQISASLTYTTLLSIVPILTIILVILSSIPILQPVREQVYSHVYNNLMPESGIQVKQYLQAFASKSANLTTIGLSFLLYTSMSTLLKIELAFNDVWNKSIYQEHHTKSSLRNVIHNIMVTLFRYLFILTVVPIVLGVAFVVSGAIQGLGVLQQLDMGNMDISKFTNMIGIDGSWLTSMGPILWAKAISVCITAIGFGAMYWFIPKAKVPIKHAMLAGVIVALLFEGLRLAFGWIVSEFTSYASVYGAFAVLPVFIIWINLSWSLILLGVEISYCLAKFRCQRPSKIVEAIEE